jgi:predicted RNase H-like nuclease (RuvC/YqgF family)
MVKHTVKGAAAVVTAAVLFSLACALPQPAEVAPPVFRVDLSGLAADDFPEKISQLEEFSQTHKDPHVRTRALYYLALAYMHYNNPQPDYIRALGSLDQYMTLDPSDENKDEIVAWKSVLSSLDSTLKEYEKLKENHSRLTGDLQRANKDRSVKNQKIKDLDQTLEAQKKEIEALQGKIKKLDALHQQIETKKKKKK